MEVYGLDGISGPFELEMACSSVYDVVVYDLEVFYFCGCVCVCDVCGCDYLDHDDCDHDPDGDLFLFVHSLGSCHLTWFSLLCFSEFENSLLCAHTKRSNKAVEKFR